MMDDDFNTQVRMLNYLSRRESIIVKREAEAKGLKKCQQCGNCCRLVPCLPTPEEVIKIAEFLKMGVEECVNRCFTVDALTIRSTKRSFYNTEKAENVIFLLKPVRTTQERFAGKILPNTATWTFDPCIFLQKKNKCQIHSLQLTEMANSGCWKHQSEKDGRDNFNRLISAWKDGRIREFIPNFDEKQAATDLIEESDD